MSSDLPIISHQLDAVDVGQRAHDGYINATALCKAAGKSIHHYIQNKATEDFLVELEGCRGIPRDLLVRKITDGMNENRGTWVHPQVAINLAQWASPEFAVRVTEWVLDWHGYNQQRNTEADVWLQFKDRNSLLADAVPHGYFSVFQETVKMVIALIESGVLYTSNIVPDQSAGYHWGIVWRQRRDSGIYIEDRINYPHNYPEYYPQAKSNPQEPWAYPDSVLADFRKWLREEYMTEKLPKYLLKKVKGKFILEGVAQAALDNINTALLEQRTATDE